MNPFHLTEWAGRPTERPEAKPAGGREAGRGGHKEHRETQREGEGGWAIGVEKGAGGGSAGGWAKRGKAVKTRGKTQKNFLKKLVDKPVLKEDSAFNWQAGYPVRKARNVHILIDFGSFFPGGRFGRKKMKLGQLFTGLRTATTS